MPWTHSGCSGVEGSLVVSVVSGFAVRGLGFGLRVKDYRV